MAVNTGDYIIQRILQELKVKRSMANFSTAGSSEACSLCVTAGQRRDGGTLAAICISASWKKIQMCMLIFSSHLQVLLQVTPAQPAQMQESCTTWPELLLQFHQDIAARSSTARADKWNISKQ